MLAVDCEQWGKARTYQRSMCRSTCIVKEKGIGLIMVVNSFDDVIPEHEFLINTYVAKSAAGLTPPFTSDILIGPFVCPAISEAILILRAMALEWELIDDNVCTA